MKKTIYIWQGTNFQGQKSSGEISAVSLNLAKLNLTKKGIQLITIKKKNFFYFSFDKAISQTAINLFFRQLATLISAGMTINDAFSVISQHTSQIRLAKLLIIIKENIESGKSLADSLKKFPKDFNSMTCHLIQAGEKSGTLEKMLERVALYQEKKALMKNKIKQACFYPCIIIIIALLVSVILLLFVVPKFADLFATLHGSLPVFTLAVIQLAQLIKQHGLLILFLLIINSFIIQKKIDYLLIKLPMINIIYKKIILIRFAESLAIILSAGITIAEALKIITYTLGHPAYTTAIEQLFLDISGGKQLHTALAMHPHLFSSMITQMVEIGEESGNLDKMLLKIAELYQNDVDYFIANLNLLLEPLIMSILGVLIGGLVIAMYLPIFKLGTVI